MDQQFVVFVSLQRGEEHAEDHGDGQARDQVPAVVLMRQRMVGPCHGTARQQQHQRVDQRQVKGVNRVDFGLDVL